MVKRNILHIFIQLALISIVYIVECKESITDIDYRLPKYWDPISYEISLTLYPENANFSGVLNLTYEVINDDYINEIYLHVDTEFIYESSLDVLMNDQYGCAGSKLENTSIFHIQCLEGIGENKNLLYITYKAKYSTEDGYGLVKSNYKVSDDEEVILHSYFQPTFARRVFPCMDEPDFRATFSIEVTYPTEYNAISNSPIATESYKVRSYLQTTKFETTPKISPHLVSIIISKLQSGVEDDIDDEIEHDFKLYTRPEAVALTSIFKNYYNEVSTQFEYFTGSQGISNTKTYHVAIPDYTKSTENFGLFTYREIDVLDEGEETSRKVQQNILTTMTNKLSHQLCGGEISTKWWSDVWANEAIATYLEYMLADQVTDEMELDYQFVVEVVQKAMQYDALPLAKPLSSNESDIYLTNDIENKLNTYSYYKGASILRMIGYIFGGEEDFKESLQYYLNNRTQLGTDGNTLLSVLVDSTTNEFVVSSGKERIYSLLKPWVFEQGFPLVTVFIQNITENNVEIMQLLQKRFVYPTSATTDTTIHEFTTDNVTNDGIWAIPFSDTHSNLKDYNVTIVSLFEPEDEFYYIYGSDSWVIFNLQASAFHRVNYDDELWGRLIGALKTENTDIHVLNRAQLIDDIFNIARIGDVSYSLVFDLADYLIDETEYYPWYSAFNAFSYLIGKMEDIETEENLEAYLLKQISNIVEIPSSVSTESTHIDVLKNVMILTWACKLGHNDCIKFATENFNAYKDDQTSIEDYNLRGLILCNGLRYSDNFIDDWILLWSIYQTSESVHEQDDVLNALGCVDHLILLQSYLDKVISVDSGLKEEDVLVVFKTILSSTSLGVDLVLEFLENNYKDVVNLYGNENTSITYKILEALAEKLITDNHIERLQNIIYDTIFDDHLDAINAIEVLVAVNNYWAKNYRSDIKNILEQYTKQ